MSAADAVSSPRGLWRSCCVRCAPGGFVCGQVWVCLENGRERSRLARYPTLSDEARKDGPPGFMRYVMTKVGPEFLSALFHGWGG